MIMSESYCASQKSSEQKLAAFEKGSVCDTAGIEYNTQRGTKERQILAEPRQDRKVATVREFLWVFRRATYVMARRFVHSHDLPGPR